MIHLPASVRVYLCLTACDMRKSFDGLHTLVREHLELDAFGGHLFVFASRRRDRVKILYWDRDGFAVWSKRLEEGTYGNCFECGDEIAEARLRALPFALRCKDCEEARETAEQRERAMARKSASSTLFYDMSN